MRKLRMRSGEKELDQGQDGCERGGEKMQGKEGRKRGELSLFEQSIQFPPRHLYELLKAQGFCQQ